VQGKIVKFDSEPYIDENNRLMVPLRAIVEALGAKVDWSLEKRTINISGDVLGKKKSILFVIDEKTAIVDDARNEMDTCPVIKNSRTMIPARYVSEFMGATVNWNGETRTVTVE
ncbi:MAG: copper amine oxidase N-terminal domain-containing protein, partial [Clostridia bacterium]|nr:copper amine oxidase N-terminal domain-containing protein [Clostridia bacterium]